MADLIIRGVSGCVLNLGRVRWTSGSTGGSADSSTLPRDTDNSGRGAGDCDRHTIGWPCSPRRSMETMSARTDSRMHGMTVEEAERILGPELTARIRATTPRPPLS